MFGARILKLMLGLLSNRRCQIRQGSWKFDGTKYGTPCICRISRYGALKFGMRVTDGVFDERAKGFIEICTIRVRKILKLIKFGTISYHVTV